MPSRATVPPTGGQVATGSPGVEVLVPAQAAGVAGAVVEYLSLRPEGVPPAPAGLQMGERAFQLTLADAATGRAVARLVAPLVLSYRPTAAELARAGDDLGRIKVASWNERSWGALACGASGGALTCSLPHLSLFAVLVVPREVGVQDWEVPGGWFFKEANGFNGAGEAGFALTDDEQAGFWSEFQRLGGVARAGYPVSGRFLHRGFLTQVFQKLALQWRPEEGRAVPVNVFDDLNRQGADGWLEAFRQVPRAADTSGDAGLDWEAVVARHVGLLDPYPALREYYLSDPDWLETYGLPLAVEQYGPVVGVRLQRATLQLWTVDVPWAQAGTVVVGNGGDLAKEAGLWPPEAVTPGT
ncbi:MAG: hypothetical protein HY690_04855 [Chloroflexi bacterium]|nr:hypothetical protein [Chloroflexota bacterium]